MEHQLWLRYQLEQQAQAQGQGQLPPSTTTASTAGGAPSVTARVNPSSSAGSGPSIAQLPLQVGYSSYPPTYYNFSTANSHQPMIRVGGPPVPKAVGIGVGVGVGVGAPSSGLSGRHPPRATTVGGVNSQVHGPGVGSAPDAHQSVRDKVQRRRPKKDLRPKSSVTNVSAGSETSPSDVSLSPALSARPPGGQIPPLDLKYGGESSDAELSRHSGGGTPKDPKTQLLQKSRRDRNRGADADAEDDADQDGEDGEELDAHRLAQRQKQVNFGKVTPGYRYYRFSVPPFQRQYGNPNHPMTPRTSMKCSKRKWDNMVATWRRALHAWDGNPRVVALSIPGAPTMEQLGKLPGKTLNLYVKETQDELDQVENAIKMMQNAKTAVYPGDLPSESSGESSGSDRDQKGPKVVIASAPPAATTAGTGKPAELDTLVHDIHSLPFVPSPVEDASGRAVSPRHDSPAPLHPATPCLPTANFLLLRVMQRRTMEDHNEQEGMITLNTGTPEQIHEELKKKFGSDLSNVFFRLNVNRSPKTDQQGSSEAATHQRPETPHNATAGGGLTPRLVKPQPAKPTVVQERQTAGGATNNNSSTTTSFTTTCATPEIRSHNSTTENSPAAATSLPADAERASSSQGQQCLFLDSIDHLRILLTQKFAPTIYYISEKKIPDEDEDLMRELQLTPSRYQLSELNFSMPAMMAPYTPNPYLRLEHASVSPNHPWFRSESRAGTGSVTHPAVAPSSQTPLRHTPSR